jgi:hypothetical protein
MNRNPAKGDVITDNHGKHFLCTGETEESFSFRRLSPQEARELEAAKRGFAREYSAPVGEAY